MIPCHPDINLSHIQMSMLAHEEIEGFPLYNMPVRVRISGPANVEVLARAVEIVVRRHPLLHSILRDDVLRDDSTATAPILLTQTTRDDAEVSILRDLLRPFDLARHWPIRVLITQTASMELELFLNIHHVAGDSWSISVLLREIAQAYRRVVDGEGEISTSCVARVSELAASNVENEQWWTTQLSSLPMPRAERKRALEPPGLPGLVEGAVVEIDAATTRAMRSLSATLRTTPESLFLTALYGCLKACGRSTELVAMTFHMRDDLAALDTVAPLLASICLPTNPNIVAGNFTFTTRISYVTDLVKSVAAHKTASFSKVYRALNSSAPKAVHVLNVDNNRLSLPIDGCSTDFLTVPLSYPTFPCRWEFSAPKLGNLCASLHVDPRWLDEISPRDYADRMRSQLQEMVKEFDA